MEKEKKGKLRKKILLSLLCIVAVGWGIWVYLVGMPWQLKAIPEDVVTLQDALPLANQYMREHTKIGRLEIILIKVEVNPKTGRGVMDITYEWNGPSSDRYEITVDTEAHTILGNGGNPQIHGASIHPEDWLFDSDEIIELAEKCIEERIGAFEYTRARIHTMIEFRPPLASVEFQDKNGNIDNARLHMNLLTGEVHMQNEDGTVNVEPYH